LAGCNANSVHIDGKRDKKKKKATAKLDVIAHRAWIEIVLEEIATTQKSRTGHKVAHRAC
jgi:hypothetical protein